MPEARQHDDHGERERFIECLREVNIARQHLQAARHEVSRSWEKQGLRAELLAALEVYAAAISALGAPVPRKLRAEIELYRRLGDRS